jgi:hypothetical protein
MAARVARMINIEKKDENMKNCAWLLIFFASTLAAQSLNNHSVASCGKETRIALIQAARAVGQMTASGPALEWELEKSDAHRTINLLVSVAENPSELTAAGYANDALGQQELCKLEIDAGESSEKYSNCLKDVNNYLNHAISTCGLSSARVYPHSQKE